MAEELNVDRTPGFKVGEKKTIDEYQKLGEYSPATDLVLPSMLAMALRKAVLRLYALPSLTADQISQTRMTRL